MEIDDTNINRIISLLIDTIDSKNAKIAELSTKLEILEMNTKLNKED